MQCPGGLLHGGRGLRQQDWLLAFPVRTAPGAYPWPVMYQNARTPQEEGGVPPLFLPFQCLRLTAKVLLRRLRCQEDLRFKSFGAPSAGAIGGPWEEGGPSPFQTHFRPPPPFLTHACPWPPPVCRHPLSPIPPPFPHFRAPPPPHPTGHCPADVGGWGRHHKRPRKPTAKGPVPQRTPRWVPPGDPPPPTSGVGLGTLRTARSWVLGRPLCEASPAPEWEGGAEGQEHPPGGQAEGVPMSPSERPLPQ